MASMYCWPSVSIKCGASFVITRKADFEWTFGYLLTVFLSETVACVITSKNDQFIDPVPLDSPLALCQQYGSNVCYYLTSQQSDSEGRMQ